jgi:LysM repeat protein
MYGTYASDSYGATSSSRAPPPGRALADPSPFRYEVRAGDTLESIADKLNTTEKKLLKLNPLLANNASSSRKSSHRIKVYPGQQLVVEEARQVSLPPPPETIDHGWGQMHVMRAGETLRDVATLYNTTEALLRQDNRKYFPAGERGAVFPGQMLLVRYVNIGQLEPEEQVAVASSGSSSTGSSPASVSGVTGLARQHTTITKYKSHRITKSDTFASLCDEYSIDYATLLQINRGRFPVGARAELVVGEQLIVPDLAASQAEQSRRNVAEIKLTKQIHVVEDGETPHGLAERFRMTYDELREWNRASFPKGYRGEIRAGNKLVVRRLDDQEERRDRSDDESSDDERTHGYNSLA